MKQNALVCERLFQTCVICCIKCSRYDILYLAAFYACIKKQPSLMNFTRCVFNRFVLICKIASSVTRFDNF